MKRDSHVLSNIWDNYLGKNSEKRTEEYRSNLSKNLKGLLSAGQFYYYFINFADNSISNVSNLFPEIHGNDVNSDHIGHIIDLIHPDDIHFVIIAEEFQLKHLKNKGGDYLKNVKSSYCFRMKVANGDYHLFHHQALILALDDKNRAEISLNIHTDIDHITKSNNHLLLLQGVKDRSDYEIFDLKKLELVNSIPLFSKRELEILPYIANGMSSRVIGETLFISEETVRVHRKNILKKTDCANSNVMIKKCLEWGIL